MILAALPTHDVITQNLHKLPANLFYKKADTGLLICGSGIGMAIAANRFKGIYAGVAWNPEIAQAAREDDNINMLVLPADYITHLESPAIITAWINAQFKEGRYTQRLQAIDQ
jgi:Ribose 5-phosphate isomerase RpiB